MVDGTVDPVDCAAAGVTCNAAVPPVIAIRPNATRATARSTRRAMNRPARELVRSVATAFDEGIVGVGVDQCGEGVVVDEQR